MSKKLLLAGLVPASLCWADPTAYTELGGNVAAMGAYVRYGILQESNGFTLDTAINLNASLLMVHSLSFSTGIYGEFDAWRIGPEFSIGVAKYDWAKSIVYTSYALRTIYDLDHQWSATASFGFHSAPKMLRDLGINSWPVFSMGLQRHF